MAERLLTSSQIGSINALADQTAAAGKRMTYTGSNTGAMVDEHPGYAASRYYGTFAGARSTSAAVDAVATIYAYVFEARRAVTVASLVARIITGQSGAAIKMALYADQGGKPFGAPLVADDTGLATITNGVNVTFTPGSPVVLQPGWYWILQKWTGTLPTPISIATTSHSLEPLMGRIAIATAAITGWSLAHTYATAWPTMAGSESWLDHTTGGNAIVWLLTPP